MYHLIELISLANAFSTCIPACVEGCSALNGNYRLECSTCEKKIACNPTVFNFEQVVIENNGHMHIKNDLEYLKLQNDESEICKEIDIHDLTSEILINQKTPLLIKNVTNQWIAMEKWTLSSIIKHYGSSFIHLHDKYNLTLSNALKVEKKYYMGHVLSRRNCYADPWRPYTLILQDMKQDFVIPDVFKPMQTFQIGIGFGKGVGVPPENHPASWFAMIQGEKSWIVHPPSDIIPQSYLQHDQCTFEQINSKLKSGTYCLQKKGDIFWLPDFWWHETCGLSDFSVGIGGVVNNYENAYEKDSDADLREISPPMCIETEYEKKLYSIYDIPFCNEKLTNCYSLEDFNKPEITN